MRVEGRFLVVWVLLFVTLGCPPVSSDTSGRMDVFHQVLEELEVASASALPPAKVTEYFDAVLDRLLCADNNASAVQGLDAETTLGTCQEKLCLDTAGLITTVEGDPNVGLTEEQFHAASMVALYLVSKGKHPCGATLNPSAGSLTLASIRSSFVSSISEGGQLSEEQLEEFLHDLEDVYEGEEHDHEEDSHEHDHDHDHEEHTRRKRSGDDEEHDGHDHEEEEEEEPRVFEAECLSPDAVMYYLHLDDETSVDAADNIDDISTVIVYLMSHASAMEEECRLLPKRDFFIDTLISKTEPGQQENLTKDGLKELMESLDILPGAAEGHDDHGHDHRRRRSVASDLVVSRVKRQAPTTDTRCYSPAELSAIFDVGDTLTPEELTQLSPALIYQKLYGECAMEVHVDPEGGSSNKWLYGILTVFIVCLCSLFGVVLVPCMRSVVYKLSMALFVGLAVGTLTGDAILHLIPSAMGAHEHEHGGHAHDGPIVVEEFVWFALVILAGIYGFYLLEAVFNRCWHTKIVPLDDHTASTVELTSAVGSGENSHGHSHDLELTITPNGKGQPETTQDTPPVKPSVNTSLTVMIVLGDAVHNFADGLAIGAAFSSGTGVGIATGIAVFCHELPHELGDFAVLLKNGLTVCWAVFWNLISSLTAFLGLFISLAVATDDKVQTWIFAVAAGMFLYIALTDLLPQMTTKENCQDTPVFILNNIGILLGVFLMLIIAIFEERIVID